MTKRGEETEGNKYVVEKEEGQEEDGEERSKEGRGLYLGGGSDRWWHNQQDANCIRVNKDR